MLFVDGENLTARAEQLATIDNFTLEPGPYHRPGVFVWIPKTSPDRFHLTVATLTLDWQWAEELEGRGARAHYYTSVVGSDDTRDTIRTSLWDLGFSPYVFKKDKSTGKTKGVDVTLTKDVLSHAFQDNYDVAFLVAGDGDYVPLVEEVKRRGKIVYVAFFEGSAELGLNPELRLASDRFFPLNASFVNTWKAYTGKAQTS